MGLTKRMFSELIGTFIMVFCGAGAIVVNQLTGAITHFGIAALFGLVVAAVIFSFGSSSGAHINPSVSLTLFVLKKMSLKELVVYVSSQITGAILACLLLSVIFPDAITLGQTNPSGSEAQTFILEMFITFILMLTVLRIPESDTIVPAALSVGCAVFILALFAGPISGASMNPARSIGPSIVSGDVSNLWIYIVAPCLGALMAIPVNRVLT
jgi:aquaporin NIP